MPTLPTMDLSQEHYDRVVAAFPGTTPAQKANAYNAWLTNRLIERVEAAEFARIDREANEAKLEALADLNASLPPRVEEPELP